jgi:hypothetical protein
MAALTFTIEPDEFLGLSALVDLDRASNAGNAGTGADADVVGLARTLTRGALADKLRDAGLPWAPSAEAVRQRTAEAAAPASGMRKLMASKKAQKDAMYILAVAFAVVLWGGYARGWKWTGFQASGQLWDWLGLLLLPVGAVGGRGAPVTHPHGGRTGLPGRDERLPALALEVADGVGC